MNLRIILLASILFSACSVFQTKNPDYPDLNPSYTDEDVLEMVGGDEEVEYPVDSNSSDTITITVDFDSVVMKSRTYLADTSFTIRVGKESGLLVIGDSIALRFYHAYFMDHGYNRHIVKHEILILHNESWRIFHRSKWTPMAAYQLDEKNQVAQPYGTYLDTWVTNYFPIGYYSLIRIN